MKRIGTLLFASALLLTPATALADYGNRRHGSWSKYDRPTYGYNNHYSYGYGRNRNDNRFGSRNDPIRYGIRTGKLSQAEVRELREDQRDIRQKQREYLRDGYLSDRERASLRDDYQDFREDLKHELTDGERRY